MLFYPSHVAATLSENHNRVQFHREQSHKRWKSIKLNTPAEEILPFNEGEVIEEKIYPKEKHSIESVLEMCEEIPSEEQTKEFIGMRPNTCHFTKEGH